MEKSLEKIRIVNIRYFCYKICLNVFLIALLSSYQATAQDQRFLYGGKFGIGESTINSESFANVNSKLMLSGGFSADYYFNDYLGLGMDFMLTSKGAKVDGFETTYDLLGNPKNHTYQSNYQLYYTEIPLMVLLRANLGGFYPKVFGGPSANFKLSASETRSFDEPEYDADHGYSLQKLKNTSTTEYAINYGAGADIPDRNGRVYFVELKISRGLNSFAMINSQDVKSNYYGIFAGYKF